MRKLAASLFVCILFSLPARAEIFKCVEGGKTTYSNSPCNREQRERVEAEAAVARKAEESAARKQREEAAKAREAVQHRQAATDEAVRKADAARNQRTIGQDRAIFEQCMKDFQDPLTDPGVKAALRGMCARFREDFRQKWGREP